MKKQHIMKSLIKFSLIVLVFGISSQLYSQITNDRIDNITNGNGSLKEYKLPMTTGTLNIVDINEVRVEGYSGSEIVISTLVENSESNERAAGLKLVNSLGLEDNTGFGISVSKEGNIATARQLSDNCSCNEITIKVPKGVNISLSHRTHDAENILIQKVSSEVEISTTYHNVKLEDVTGPMAIKTVHGSIDARFSSLSQNGSVSLYSAHDFVDVTIPPNAKMNVSIEAPYGDVYSNADINITKKATSSNSNSCYSGSSINGTLNGGGVEFSIKSAHDDVYLRQGGNK
jgi:hypothetical protein